MEKMNDLLKYIRIVEAAGCTLEISVRTDEFLKKRILLCVENPSLERGCVDYIEFDEIKKSPELDPVGIKIEEMIVVINELEGFSSYDMADSL